MLDDPNDVDKNGEPRDVRKNALVNELNLRRYPQGLAELAETYILLGPPVRYGSLTLADFYPDAKMLESVGVSIDVVIAKAERDAQARGYDQGYHAAQREKDERRANAPAPKILEEDEWTELIYLRGKCEALERECDQHREDEVKRQKRERFDRNPTDTFLGE